MGTIEVQPQFCYEASSVNKQDLFQTDIHVN